METLMWKASNVVISYGALRASSATQEKKQGQQGNKTTDKARLAEKSVTPTGNGRSFVYAPLPLASARNLVPAPLRFLWFPSNGKNEDDASNSTGRGSQTRELDKPFEEDLEKDVTHREVDGDTLVEKLESQQFGNAGLGFEPLAETEIEGRMREASDELHKFENGNAGKRWFQNLLNVNFLKRSPRIEVEVPSPEVQESVISSGDVVKSELKVETLEQACASAAGNESSVVGSCCGCVGCASECLMMDPAANPLSTLEVPHVDVNHDVDSFSKFLSEVPLTELKILATTSFLSNLAYAIPEIKPRELAKFHHMVFVTSSVDIKAEALAKEKAAAAAKERLEKSERSEVGGESRHESYLSPATAAALAAAATSFLRTQRKDKRLDTQGEEGADLNASKIKVGSKEEPKKSLDSGSEDFLGGETDASGTNCESELSSSEMTAFMQPVTSVVSAETNTKQEVANNLRSLHTCPCEWFACDEKSGYTRFFSIQGSGNFASWQANLLFEPIQFESSDLGVMVHRGIYEAAIGLYEQILPYVLEHQERHGERARFQFSGHSLGGSLGVLLSLMLNVRGVVETSALLPVYTFGSPYVMCGGDYLLKRLGLPLSHVRYVVMHRDIVPRSFACNYPDHIAEVLKRVNGTFRDHTCLTSQRQLYAPMGQLMVLQPDQPQASPHPLLPGGSGLYLIRHQSHNEPPGPTGADGLPVSSRAVQVRAAQRAFLNKPHPLEIISDPAAYGSEGTIAKYHDPRNYCKAINSVLRQDMRRWRRVQRERRRQLWRPLISADSAYFSSKSASLGVQKEQGAPKGITSKGMCGPSGLSHFASDLAAGRATFPILASGDLKGRFSRYKSLIASQHVQMGMLVLLTAKMLLSEGLLVVLAWV